MNKVYATRKSQLALAQSRAFVSALQSRAPALVPTELTVVTSGDRIQDRPLSEVGGKGLFVKEIEEALLERRADLAVHSIKDVPAELPPGLMLACIPQRVDARDVLVSPRYGNLAELPEGARVGTSSLRRSVMLLRARPDLAIVPLRGNVDTRLRKVDEGQCDAIVLAHAGLIRLGLASRATAILDVDVVLPAVGQGALGIECREDDVDTRELLDVIRDAETELCVSAERGVMRALEGDCKTPIGAHAVYSNGILDIAAFVSEPDGSSFRQKSVRAALTSPEDARRVGDELGHSLRSRP